LKKNIALALLLSFLSACSSSEQTAQSTSADVASYFFNLDCYIQKELKNLEAVNEVRKVVAINGNQKEQFISNLDFAKELSSFSKADINRLAWKDKYQVDTIRSDEGELLEIRHTALDEDLKTQFLMVSFQNELVDSVLIRNEVSGFATKNTKEMLYVPKVGYSIKSNQETLIGLAKDISVEVSFRN